MNKKGAYVLVGIMMAAFVLVTVISLIPAMKEQVVAGRVNMDCSSTNLSSGDVGVCILLDSWVFVFVGVSLAAALAYISIKQMGG